MDSRLSLSRPLRAWYDNTEPFPLADLRPAPKLLTALANVLQYIIKQHELEHLWYYLHDIRKFFFGFSSITKRDFIFSQCVTMFSVNFTAR